MTEQVVTTLRGLEELEEISEISFFTRAENRKEGGREGGREGGGGGGEGGRERGREEGKSRRMAYKCTIIVREILYKNCQQHMTIHAQQQ